MVEAGQRLRGTSSRMIVNTGHVVRPASQEGGWGGDICGSFRLPRSTRKWTCTSFDVQKMQRILYVVVFPLTEKSTVETFALGYIQPVVYQSTLSGTALSWLRRRVSRPPVMQIERTGSVQRSRQPRVRQPLQAKPLNIGHKNADPQLAAVDHHDLDNLCAGPTLGVNDAFCAHSPILRTDHPHPRPHPPHPPHPAKRVGNNSQPCYLQNFLRANTIWTVQIG